MKTQKIISLLKDIQQVSKFQQKRIKNKKAFNRKSILMHSTEVIIKECLLIQEYL